jgi:O-Antigen ligase
MSHKNKAHIQDLDCCLRMKSLNDIQKKNVWLRNSVLYILACSMGFWGLGADIPGTDQGIFTIGIILLVISYGLLQLSQGLQSLNSELKRPYFRCALFFSIFVLIAFLENMTEFSNRYIIRYFASISFYLILVGMKFDLKVNERVRLIVVYTAALYISVLVYWSLFVTKTPYLSPHLDYAKNGAAYKNTLSFFFVTIFPYVYASASKKLTIIKSFLIILFAFAVLYTNSRMGLLDLILSFILFIILGSRKLSTSKKKHAYALNFVFIIPALIVLALNFNTALSIFDKIKHHNTSFLQGEGEKGSRSFLIKVGLKKSIEHPFFGHGLESFRMKAGDNLLPHNDYVSIMYELGYIALAFYISFLFLIIRDHLRIRKYVPPEYSWLWDAHTVNLFQLIFSFNFINIYESFYYWFILASGPLIRNAVISNSKKAETTLDHKIGHAADQSANPRTGALIRPTASS